MSADGRSNSDGNIALKGASTEAHSLWMSMENLRIRDDTEGQNRGYQLGTSNGHVHSPDPRANNPDVLWDGQLRTHENVEAIQDKVYNMGAVLLIEGNTKRQVKLTEKGREYKMALLEKKRSKLVSRVIRKSSEIDDLMYSFQNGIAVKEELQKLNDMFEMLVEIHEELENVDDHYTDELWFEDIDQKVFSFKHKVHNWLREVKKLDKSGRSSKSSQLFQVIKKVINKGKVSC